jgi:hypothetical protein
VRLSMLSLALVAVLLLASVPAHAGTITLAGYTFSDNAFADQVLSCSGQLLFNSTGILGDNQWLGLNNFADLESAIIGSNLNTYVSLGINSLYLELGFSDNLVVNGPGADLVLFELSRLDDFSVSLTVGGPVITAVSNSTGYSNGNYGVNAALVDLSSLGVQSGNSVDRIVLHKAVVDNPNPFISVYPDVAAVGALNSVPVPEPGFTLLLLGIAFVPIAVSYRWWKK